MPQKFTVSELTGLIKLSLEEGFPAVLVEGELSNWRPSSTGHYYFSMKDPGAKIDAVMFKNRRSSLRFEPKDGMLVRARGRISVYPQRGNYQLVAEEMELAGQGDILAMLENRKRALAAEGLFDDERKKPIPRFPETVAVVSSPTGAAVQDILNILRRRAEGINVIVLPAPVQGADAAPIIARRIEQANQWKLADVIIVGRGGGALEDLLPFSEEVVVRAVAASEIPVVSAVGHEIDNAISDLAADLRAPTPSAAAELVSARRGEALETVKAAARTMTETITDRIGRARLLLKPFDPEDLEYRFRAILQPRLIRLDDAKEQLLENLSGRIADLRRRLELASTVLEAGSPLAILERGFAVVTREENGEVLRRAGQTAAGDRLRIRLMEGSVEARTEQCEIEANG
ncbi:MAG: exodeoxyribonuclease VII large subunit [Treponema sp.]|jgi:exodeoxyribonuclease VII large subunit|nr:exodeoxyribonuclease VII large subunit [Treponema sp.]